MPTSPLPNSAVSEVPPPELIESVVVVVPLSSPQAARKAATAVVVPPTARNLRRETGSLSCLISAIGRVPPGRLLARPYGGGATGGSESRDGHCDQGGRAHPRRGDPRPRLDRRRPVRLGAGDDALRRDRGGRGGPPASRVRGPGAAGGDPRGGAAGARVAPSRRGPARAGGHRRQLLLLRRAGAAAARDHGHARVRRPARRRDRRLAPLAGRDLGRPRGDRDRPPLTPRR